MIDEKALIGIVAASTQEECRQIGELFMSFVNTPRDAQWRGQMRRTLAMYPDAPKSDLAVAIEQARARVRATEDELFAAGWHPAQMRAELEQRGYAGLSEPTATSALS